MYSTCTFAPAENEGSISRFLERHPEFELLPAEKKDGMMPGVPAWTEHPGGWFRTHHPSVAAPFKR